MGLDMYAWVVPSERVIDDLTFKSTEEEQPEQLFYWRKHHDLHGWMTKLYESKGGQGEFNCKTVRLTAEDLFQLEIDVRENRLPSTTGFFFGNNPPDADSIARDLEFIRSAIKAISSGDAVYYDSWW